MELPSARDRTSQEEIQVLKSPIGSTYGKRPPRLAVFLGGELLGVGECTYLEFPSRCWLFKFSSTCFTPKFPACSVCLTTKMVRKLLCFPGRFPMIPLFLEIIGPLKTYYQKTKPTSAGIRLEA